MAKVCLITPTGGRPEGMELLAHYIARQSCQRVVNWVIVDDVDPATPLPDIGDNINRVEIIRPEWRWQPGDNTQCRSMYQALQEVGDDDIAIIIEDDDCYLPDHLATTLKELETCELVGEQMSRYYNVATRRWKLMPGKVHASLASNAVRGGALKLLREICRNGTRTIDLDLWRQFQGPKRLTEHANVIGIKGLPGRGGIGVGHRQGFGRQDADGVLRRWLCDYADMYEPFARAA